MSQCFQCFLNLYESSLQRHRFESLPSGFRCVFRVEFAGPALETGVKAWVSDGVLVVSLLCPCLKSSHMLSPWQSSASLRFRRNGQAVSEAFSILKPRKHIWQDVVSRDQIPCSTVFTYSKKSICYVLLFIGTSLSLFLHVCLIH